MRYCKIDKVLKAMPEARTIRVPHDWFDALDSNTSVFTSLYRWMVDAQGVPDAYFYDLHNLTYIGQLVYRRLLAFEKRRIAKRNHLRGEALQRALSWADMGSGPHTLFADMAIPGDLIIIIPAEARDKMQSVQVIFQEKEREKKNSKIRQLSSGENFAQWLFSNSERDDPIGDLARDALSDSDFPRGAKCHEEVRRYLEHYSSVVMEALDDAWLEYSEKYPDRIVRQAWCDECCEQITGVDDGVISWGEEGFRILHERCLNDDVNKQVSLKKLFLQTSVLKHFESFVNGCNPIPEDVEKLKNRLIIWGWVKGLRFKDPQIYFIQSGSAGPIKIGYTASSVGRRLATLQTAHPEKLTLLAHVAGDRAKEKALHSRFESHRLEGEWFNPDHEILNMIEELNRQR